MNTTAATQTRMPAAIFRLIGSPNITVPIRMAVSGSNTPRTEVLVGPMQPLPTHSSSTSPTTLMNPQRTWSNSVAPRPKSLSLNYEKRQVNNVSVLTCFTPLPCHCPDAVSGKGALETISEQLRAELPGLRGFSSTNLKVMRIFYEEWKGIEANSPVATDELY